MKKTIESVNLQAVREVYQEVDVLLTDIVARARDEGHKIPCKRGCSACCYDVAIVTHYEIVPILDAIRKMPKEQQEKIRADTLKWAENMAHKTISVNSTEPDLRRYHAEPKAKCPLLDAEKGECMVYEHRPPACRFHIVGNIEPAACANRQNEPQITALELHEPVARTQMLIVSSMIKKTGHRTIPVLALMIPGMLLHAWRAIENPELSLEDWLEGVNQAAIKKMEK